MKDEERISAWLQMIERKVTREGNDLLSDTGLTVMQFRVMKYLERHPDEPQIADLSDFFDVTHTSMVHVVNSLEEKGYVYREPIRRSRGKKIILTDTGMKVLKKNDRLIDCLESSMLEGFSRQEIKSLREMLKRISKNMEA